MSETGRVLSPCCNGEPLGYEVRGVYDGVLFWLCQACGSAWNRWSQTDAHRHRVAQGYVDAVNLSRRLAGD